MKHATIFLLLILLGLAVMGEDHNRAAIEDTTSSASEAQ
jgi:hypothetical protein